MLNRKDMLRFALDGAKRRKMGFADNRSASMDSDTGELGEPIDENEPAPQDYTGPQPKSVAKAPGSPGAEAFRAWVRSQKDSGDFDPEEARDEGRSLGLTDEEIEDAIANA